MKPKKKNSKQIHQKKSLSQVFLKESWPCEEIAQNLVDNGIKAVLEIGPGSGALTKELLKKGLKVIAVEKDERFSSYLEKDFRYLFEEKQIDFTVINDDFLNLNLPEFLDSHPEITAICGNIPYAISTGIISKILPELQRLKQSILLVQLEYAERLASPPGKKSYGSLSVYTQLRSKVCFDFIVEKECFTPIPKVDSAVISFFAKESPYPEALLQKVEKITKTVFSQRRKKMSNSLKPFLSSLEPTHLTLDLSRRCDNLSPEEFVALAKELYPNLDET